MIDKILQDIKSVFQGQDWKKLLKANIPYLAFFYVGNIFSAHVRAYRGGDIIDRIMTATVEIGTMRLLPSFNLNDLLIGLLVAGFIRFIVYNKGKKAKKFREGKEYGSARWGNAKDIQPYIDEKYDNNVLFTNTERLTMNGRPKNPKYARNKNVLVIGGSGSGKTNIKYMYTTILYVIYILGYTAQNTVTRAGQAIVTDDPKIRPIVSATDTIATQLVFALIPLLITTILAPKFSVGEFADGKGLINPETWKYAVLILAPISFLLTCIAAYGISAKDRPENYKLVESGEKFKFSDYKKVIANNRPLQMLIVAASTDKIGQLLTNGISTYLFANLLLNSSLQGNFGLITVIPIIICAFIGVKISRTFGMKRTFVVASWVNIVLTALMFLVGTNPEKPWIFLSLFLLQKALFGMGSGVVLPMVGDCADYEFYRSGNFIPGMIGTTFSFVDKAMSSLSTVIQGAALAVAGVGATKIIPNQPVSGYFNTVVLFCICIVPLLGSVASVIAMKYYKLDISTMMTIREENIRRRKEGMPEVLVDEIYS